MLSKNTFRKNLKLMTGQNPSPFVHAHHVFPLRHEGNFAAAGIHNIHLPAYGAWWKATPHLRKSYAYNREWDEFFETTGRTEGEILSFGRELAHRYGFKINY